MHPEPLLGRNDTLVYHSYCSYLGLPETFADPGSLGVMDVCIQLSHDMRWGRVISNVNVAFLAKC